MFCQIYHRSVKKVVLEIERLKRLTATAGFSLQVSTLSILVATFLKFNVELIYFDVKEGFGSPFISAARCISSCDCC